MNPEDDLDSSSKFKKDLLIYKNKSGQLYFSNFLENIDSISKEPYNIKLVEYQKKYGKELKIFSNKKDNQNFVDYMNQQKYKYIEVDKTGIIIKTDSTLKNYYKREAYYYLNPDNGLNSDRFIEQQNMLMILLANRQKLLQSDKNYPMCLFFSQSLPNDDYFDEDTKLNGLKYQKVFFSGIFKSSDKGTAFVKWIAVALFDNNNLCYNNGPYIKIYYSIKISEQDEIRSNMII